MRVLVVGSGAREHALVWRLSQSPKVTQLFCAPGNPGTTALARTVELPSAPDSAARRIRELGVELVVVGPEAPLVAGWVDALRAQGVLAFGPTQAAAALEGSKAFAKEVMRAAGVPTAEGEAFTSVAEAEKAARARGPCVVKADGLAAGKGVVVARSGEEAARAVREVARLGAAAERIVLEELLEGREVSLIALCDGERYLLFPPAEDHKQIGEGDRGPNTGGMGAYAPVAQLSADEVSALGRSIFAPTLAEMRKRGMPFQGALFAGLMLTPRGPRVLEFNCRFGDPETQPLMMLLDEDLLPLLVAAAEGKLPERALRIRSGVAVGVVLASAGYPESVKTGARIEGLGEGFTLPVGTAQVFHAGTSLRDGALVTSGGRVLTVCAHAPTLAEARAQAYSAVERVRFEGMQLRRDIGARPAH